MSPTTLLPKAIIAASLTLPLLLAACGDSHRPQATEIQAANPSVTYRYRGDEELLQANQKAVTFCSQYKALPRTVRISDSASEGRSVLFECLPSNNFAETSFAPNTPYAYRTDEELIDNSRNAARYCRAQGGENVVSSITTSPDGGRTATYRCVMP